MLEPALPTCYLSQSPEIGAAAPDLHLVLWVEQEKAFGQVEASLVVEDHPDHQRACHFDPGWGIGLGDEESPVLVVGHSLEGARMARSGNPGNFQEVVVLDSQVEVDRAVQDLRSVADDEVLHTVGSHKVVVGSVGIGSVADPEEAEILEGRVGGVDVEVSGADRSGVCASSVS